MHNSMSANPFLSIHERMPEKHVLGYSILIFLLLSLLLQNFVSILFSPHSSFISLGVLGFKDALLYMLFCFLLMRTAATLRISYLDFIVIFVVAVLISTSIVQRSPLLSARQLLIIPLFISAGLVMSKSLSFDKAFDMVIAWSTLVAFSGAVELLLYFVSGSAENYWPALGITEFLNNKGMGAWTFGPNGVPGNFHTFDFKFINDETYRRVVGIIAEPTLMGHILVLPTVFSVISARLLPAAFFSLVLLLTLSKGGIAATVIAVACYYIFYSRRIIPLAMVTLAGVFLLSVVLYGFYSGGMLSILDHAEGLSNNLAMVLKYPLGLGIGSSGNFANLAYNAGLVDNVVASGGESYFGAVIGQIGIPGIGLYFLLFYWVFKMPVYDVKSRALKLTVLTTLLAGFMSESAVSYVGSGLLFLLLAVHWRQCNSLGNKCDAQ